MQEPLQFMWPAQEYAAQNHAGYICRILHGIGQRQRAAPGAAENQPLLDTEGAAQRINIVNQMGNGIFFDAALRFASAASALVEKNDAVKRGIKETSLIGIASAARAAMKKNNRLAVRVAALLIINLVIAGNH